MTDLSLSIQHGTTVFFRYKMTDPIGNVLFNNLNGKPISYLHGSGEVSEDLEKNMVGLMAGESRSFAIKDEFDQNSIFTIDVIIDSLEEIPETTSAHCGPNCQCK